jgi:hypothetical protein
VRYPNVYTDTSGIRRFDYIVEAIKRAGARKVLFGSDGPWLHPGVELHKIRLLGLPPKQEALVLGGNIIRLLRAVAPLETARDTQKPARHESREALAHAVSAGNPPQPEIHEYEL